MGLLDGWFGQQTQQPGLLSGLTGGQWNADPMKNQAVGNGLLTLGLHLMSTPGKLGQALGQSGLAGLQAYQGSLQNQRQQQMQDWQFQQMQGQAAERKALLDRLDPAKQSFQAGQAALGAAKQLGMPPGPTTGAASLIPTMKSQAESNDPLYGIPPEAIRSDLVFNNGKGLAEMLFKRGTPNIEFVNGVAIDKNKAQPGMSIPTVSQNGQASQVIVDPTLPGGYRVVAPPGAMDTYANYRNIDESARAGFDPVKVYNPDTGREEYVPRGQVVGRAGPTPQGADQGRRIPSVVQAGRDQERLAILQQELDKAMQSGRPEDIQALQREIARTKGSSPPAQSSGGGRYAAGPNSVELARGDYDKEVQKDLAGRRKTIYDSADLAGSRIADYQRLDSLLGQHDGNQYSAKGLEISKAMNAMGISVDPNMGNKEAAQALSNKMALDLRNPAGGAGMPGAMSDSDRQFLASMVPGLTASVQGRKQMLSYATSVEQRKLQVAQFARNYEQKYGRLDNGFFDQLQQWSNAHPLFQTEKAQSPGRAASSGATGGW